MSQKMNEELVAYSVRNMGDAWRWSLYSADGHVVREGLVRTEEAAEETAADAFWRGAAQGALAA